MEAEAVVPIAEEDGLLALTRFARRAAGADLAIAFEAGEDGIAVPLAADPGPPPHPFSVAKMRLGEYDWSQGPRPVAQLRMPSTILAALGRPARNVLYLATPTAEAPRSGVLLLSSANAPWQCECPFRDTIGHGVSMLDKVFAQMLTARSALMERRLLGERFHDLFESVSSGIVILEGDGTTALVNQAAATLLSIPAGETPADRLATAMRQLREGALNAAALAETYAPLQGQLDYDLIAYWMIGDRQFEVNTHPILGDGANGRIWLFNDVTAQRRAQEELRHMAGTDPLTGLANRRSFAAAGQTLIDRLQREGKPLSVLMLDIDHFKSINDRFGHPVGDKVLQAMAQRCRALMREHDLIARLGGEEFAVLLPYAAGEEGAMIAERLRAAVAAEPVGEVEVRVSIGGTSVNGGDAVLDDVLGRADKALYDAKSGGRNRVVFA
jgi:diguanylate cyclase (GGDEF)-like protein